ncbi:SURF1 family protein [Luteimonas sp. RD2P54]|uniref:SURF1-like protein n=1 Tax=Luteimonas endophytica TaxID=3042023 RepID=A0ABT6JCM8_9GAMM|nr:SURF1 family protein [Luteimonas endophytica]MDH5824567.1 SURF1 family protein [Luteimonas endophytica]
MSRRRTLLAGWTLALLAMALFATLGTWQLGRQEQKQRRLDEAALTLQRREPQPLAAAADQAAARALGWAAGTGRYLDLPAVLLDNQQRGGRPGVRVHRAFSPEPGGVPLLVDLGWLPLPADRRMPPLPPPPAARHVAGLLAPPPSAGLARAALQPQADGTLLATALEPKSVAAALGLPALAPRVLRLDPELAGGHARDLEVLPNTLPPERHLGYAVQWYGLALAVLVTALVLTFRRRARRPSDKPQVRP